MKVKEENKDYFGNKPFKHICECCGKVEIIDSKTAFDEGWDYPGDNSVYSNNNFGILSPRICGNCNISDTVWWAIVMEGRDIDELKQKHKEALERILNEPESLEVD